MHIWTASSEFGTYRLCEQRRFSRACASAQSRQNLRCSLIQAVSQEEPSDRKPDPWPVWMELKLPQLPNLVHILIINKENTWLSLFICRLSFLDCLELLFTFLLFDIWTAPSEFGTYRICEQRRFRRACASAQSRQNLRCSLIQAVSQEEP